MKVLLIKPQRTIPNNFRGVGRIFPSVGLCYIGAVLEKNGYDVKVLDAAIEGWRKINQRSDGLKYIGIDFNEIGKRIKKEKPDIVGITTLSVDAISARQIARTVKNVDSNIKVMMGGCHVSVTPFKTIADKNVDFVVVGEGEYTTLDLVKTLDEDKELYNVKGLIYRDKDKVIKNRPREYIKNLDELPFPAWHLTNMKEFFKLTKYLQGSHLTPERHLSIITSRSCPYGCIFCSVRSIMGRGFRPRSPENVVAEMEYMVNKYKIKLFSVEDDNLTFDKKRAEKIFDLMIEKRLNNKITWDTPNGVRADTLDENLLGKMKKSGAVHIFVSPESGSQRVVKDIIGKKLDLGTVENAVRICKDIGLKISCYFIVGLPGETKEDLEKTVAFASKMREFGAITLCAMARPTFGTELYDLSKKKGYLMVDGEELERSLVQFEKRGALKTPEFTPEELDEYAKRIRAGNESDEMKQIIKTKPFHAFKLFTLHPKIISNYLLKNKS
ncbi:MAG: radical SAM protein [Candidatus Aenigmatarchaeota archaeon]